MEKRNEILELSFEFALQRIEYCEQLEDHRKYVIDNLLLKSGTSIGANIRKAQNAESRQDFIHKFKISAKEAEETEYWLLLCNKSETYPSGETLLSSLTSIKKLLNAIISKTKKSINQNLEL